MQQHLQEKYPTSKNEKKKTRLWILAVSTDTDTRLYSWITQPALAEEILVSDRR